MASLPPLRIPPEFVDTATALAGLPAESFEGIVALLAEPGQEVSQRRLARAIEDTAGGGLSGRRLLEMVLSVGGLVGTGGLRDPADVANLFSKSPDLEDETTLRPTVAARLTRLLEAKATGLLGHARDLLAQHEHLLADVRILSDVRPLFAEDSADSIEGAVIGHVLRLGLVRGEPASIDVALDIEDLERIQSVVARALKKDETLRSLIKTADLPLVVPFEVQDAEE